MYKRHINSTTQHFHLWTRGLCPTVNWIKTLISSQGHYRGICGKIHMFSEKHLQILLLKSLKFINLYGTHLVFQWTIQFRLTKLNGITEKIKDKLMMAVKSHHSEDQTFHTTCKVTTISHRNMKCPGFISTIQFFYGLKWGHKKQVCKFRHLYTKRLLILNCECWGLDLCLLQIDFHRGFILHNTTSLGSAIATCSLYRTFVFQSCRKVSR